MNVVIFDVEHGSSHIIKTPNDQVIMIDAGSTETFSPAIFIKQVWGITHVSWFTVTHYDADHLTDINNIVEHLEVKTLHSPSLDQAQLALLYEEFSTPLEVFLEYKKTFDQPALPINDPSYDWGSIQFAIFGNSFSDFDHPNINDLSRVTFASYMGWNFIFPGDLEKAGWKKLLQNEEFRNRLSRVDIFIAAHHGRESGFCEEVFNYCSPRVVIMSDKSSSENSCPDKYYPFVQGLNVINPLGEVKKRYILTTRADGAIFLSIDTDGRAFIHTSK